MIKVLLCGARGRMGRAVTECIEEDPEFSLGAACDVGDGLGAALAGCDGAIDFSVPAGSVELAGLCAGAGVPAVIGTTGLDAAQLDAVREAAARVPVVFAPNYSVGVNLLFWLVDRAVRVLGPEFDLEVVEMHHRMKRDAPSGTAARIAEILAGARGLDPGRDVRHGRQGLVGERPAAEIGMHALRGGDVVGDHTAIFAGIGERLELTHRALSRATLARGALRALRWVIGRAPGLYDMQDVLGLR